MKLIELTQGLSAQVDDEDFEELSKHSWCVRWNAPLGKAWRKGYAVRGWLEGDKKCSSSMHRQIMHATKGELVDHVDGNTLNNTRANLRRSTVSLNQANRRNNVKTKCGYKGISPVGGKYWHARITKDGKLHYLGTYKTRSEAANAYNEGAKRLFGEFARLNVIEAADESL